MKKPFVLSRDWSYGLLGFLVLSWCVFWRTQSVQGDRPVDAIFLGIVLVFLSIWGIVMMFLIRIDQDRTSYEIKGLETSLQMRKENETALRQLAETASLRLVELVLDTPSLNKVVPEDPYPALAMQYKARAYHKAHAEVLEAQVKKYDPDCVDYQVRTEKLRQARDEYWELAEMLHEKWEIHKKISWKYDLPADIVN